MTREQAFIRQLTLGGRMCAFRGDLKPVCFCDAATCHVVRSNERADASNVGIHGRPRKTPPHRSRGDTAPRRRRRDPVSERRSLGRPVEIFKADHTKETAVGIADGKMQGSASGPLRDAAVDPGGGVRGAIVLVVPVHPAGQRGSRPIQRRIDCRSVVGLKWGAAQSRPILAHAAHRQQVTIALVQPPNVRTHRN
jgi:hypothetical protein